MRPVPPEINQPRPGAPLIVGRDPGGHEVAYRRDERTGVEYPYGRPFVGAAGDVLASGLARIGWRREDVNITNVVGLRPPNDDFSRHDPRAVAAGVDALHALARRLRPSLIIALGNEAAHALVPEWPGSTIFQAKEITERRGYFWQTPFGWTLTTLHPAGILRKTVPGDFLFTTDFQRARKFVEGRLPREPFPPVRRLRGAIAQQRLLQSKLVSFDIEVYPGDFALACVGFCGDAREPYVAVGREIPAFAAAIVQSRVPKVGHNGFPYDLYMMEQFGMPVRAYEHDTLQLWHSLAPELAGREDSGGEEHGAAARHRRLTRKGLAFLMSLDHNCAWWKLYPSGSEERSEYLDRMTVINGIDAWATRILADELLERVRAAGAEEAYRDSMATAAVCLTMQRRGIPIDDRLRRERLRALRTRTVEGLRQARRAALSYVKAHRVEAFRRLRTCACCGGGSRQRHHCWRCAGMEKPTTRAEWQQAAEARAREIAELPTAGARARKSRAAVIDSLPECRRCRGVGKVAKYFFNPKSPQQMRRFLYDVLRTPRQLWKGKEITDEAALRGILRWARLPETLRSSGAEPGLLLPRQGPAKGGTLGKPSS